MKLSSLFRTKSIAQIQKDAAAGLLADAEGHGSGLKRTLGVKDLTLLGVAAIIGAGIFSTIGTAAFNGGPGVALLFVFTAVACGFAALCYAEFSSMIPVAGSAYTYAYVSFGELIAWIIGWDLLMEYAIGNIAVAISWAGYFSTLVLGYGIKIPEYFQMDFLTASRGFDKINDLLVHGQTLDAISKMDNMQGALAGYTAWVNSPTIGPLHVVCNLPALAITFVITALVYIGIKESKRASNAMVYLKLGVIVLVIIVGARYIKMSNWSPFAPNGVSGVLKGVSAVFFAYIGFDAISTTAEECKNPQRDLPRGMIASLIICTVLYVAISLVMTGMVSYKQLAVSDPMAYVFGVEGANVHWIQGIIAISAVIAMAAVLLVFQLGQPRIWMSMSRDGLLPPIFSSIHPRFKTPWFSTIVAGLVVAIPSLFMNLVEVTDLTSIGTLFAFVLVCGGVLVLEKTHPEIERKFRIPRINSRYIAPAIFIVIWVLLIAFNRDGVKELFNYHAGWDVFREQIPLLIFIPISLVVVILCMVKEFSLIPVLGLMTCGYLMTQLGWTNWARFLVWLVVGLVLFFFYGSRHSKLATQETKSP